MARQRNVFQQTAAIYFRGAALVAAIGALYDRLSGQAEADGP
jgi:hypothetical protein